MYSIAAIYLVGLRTLVLALNVQQTPMVPSGSVTPCELLHERFPGQVAWPNDSKYCHGQASYWTTQQSDLTPSCRFIPGCAVDVQIALSAVLVPNNVSFSIVSGGHSANSGASNIEGGITIDLSNLAEITLVDENEAVMLGPGARWGDVYSTLESHQLTVPGARSSSVGVGGFVLGGGISWLADEYGWACDSVIEIEIVTPNAEILQISKAKNEDLFWAVKGSLGSFGIVTKIKMPTTHSKYVYAGTLGYHWRFTPRVIHALQNLNERAVMDSSTKGSLTVAWIEAEKHFVYNAYLMNTKGETWNDVFAAFKVIRQLRRTLRMTSIGDSASEINDGNPRGVRRSKFTLTCKSSYEIMMAIHELVKEFKGTVNFDHDSILGLSFEPLTVPHLLHQDGKNNIFNIDASNGPMVMVNVEFWWSNVTLDRYFEAQALNLRSAMEAQMKLLGVHHGWIYPNYAHSDQHPFDAPGAIDPAARRRLNGIKRKYDPADVWRRLVPGIWDMP